MKNKPLSYAEMNLFLAEIMSQGGALRETGTFSEGQVWAGLFFLVLMYAGVALDFALVIYCLKCPFRLSDWASALTKRALSGRLVLAFFLIFTVLYVVNSLVYGALFDSIEIEPHTLFFQMLFFEVPALVILFGVLGCLRISARESLGLTRKNTFCLLGLSVLFYLAAMPLLWFYNLLYQIFLEQVGHGFYLQDVTALFLTPMNWPVRVGVIFTAVVAAPVFEEIVFRGILFPWLVRRAGLWPGIVCVSFFFAGLHMHLPSLLPLFLLSVMFCVAYARTQSLWVPIGMHALFNGVTIILLMLMG